MVDVQVGPEAGKVGAPKKRSAGNDANLSSFVKYDRLRRTLDEKLKKVKIELERLEPLVLSHFERTGTDRVKRGGLTVYLRRQLWAGRQDGVTNEMAVEVLVANGMPEFTEPHLKTQSLSALIREMDKQHSETGGWATWMPEPIKAVIKVSEVLSVQTRTSD